MTSDRQAPFLLVQTTNRFFSVYLQSFMFNENNFIQYIQYILHIIVYIDKWEVLQKKIKVCLKNDLFMCHSHFCGVTYVLLVKYNLKYLFSRKINKYKNRYYTKKYTLEIYNKIT